MSPKDHISKAEIGKDALQDTVEATITAVGAVVTIITTAVRDIARTVGGLATEVFDIRESAGPPQTPQTMPNVAAAAGPGPNAGVSLRPEPGLAVRRRMSNAQPPKVIRKSARRKEATGRRPRARPAARRPRSPTAPARGGRAPSRTPASRPAPPWRDVPERFGNWNTIYQKFNDWSGDGTWLRLLTALQARADDVRDLDWVVAIDSTIARVHQHGATLARDTEGLVESHESRRGAT